MDSVYECNKCKGFIFFDTDSYYQDYTYQGACESCGHKARENCNEVDDAYWLKGDYAEGGSKYRDFKK